MPTAGLRNVIDCLRTAASVQKALSLTDGELLERYVAGRDEVAFEALVRRHGPMVLGVCRRLLTNPCDAEDAFQATFLVLVRKAPSVLPRDKVANWLYGVAYRAAQKARAITARRRYRERQVRTLPEPATVADGLWQDVAPLLDQELNRLPDKYRLPLVLCDLEGRTRTEAAEHLRWPQGTVAGRLARARTLLARRLARHGLPLSSGVLTALLAQNAASACVPMALVASTGKAAAAFAGGATAAAGVVSAKITLLSTGVLQAMLWNKLKVVMAGTLLAAVTLGFAGVLIHRVGAERPTEPGEVARAAEPPAGTAKGAAGKPKDEDAIQGNWTIANLEQLNHEPTKDERAAFKQGALKVVITADKIIYPDKSEATYKLDPSKTPKRIDITVASDKKVVTVPGIYSLEGGALKLCYGRKGDVKPPASFDIKKATPGMFPTCWTLRKDDSPQGKGKHVEKKTDPPEDAAARELKAMQGEWKVVRLESNGRKASADELKGMRWVFKGAQVEGVGRGEKPATIGQVKLDPGKNPRHIDLVGLEGDPKGKTLLGIYKWEKGRLSICLRDEKASRKGRPMEFTADAGSDQGLITLESLKEPPKPAVKPEPQPGKAEADVLQGKRWAGAPAVDLKVSRELVVGTTRVVLLQVSRITEFTDGADRTAPRAITSVRIVYLLEYLGDKSFGPIEQGAEVFAAGTTDSAVQGIKTTYLKGANYEGYRKRVAASRPQQAIARLPTVKDAAKTQVVEVTFEDVEVTARQVDVRLKAGLHKGEEDRHVLFRNVPLE